MEVLLALEAIVSGCTYLGNIYPTRHDQSAIKVDVTFMVRSNRWDDVSHRGTDCHAPLIAIL